VKGLLIAALTGLLQCYHPRLKPERLQPSSQVGHPQNQNAATELGYTVPTVSNGVAEHHNEHQLSQLQNQEQVNHLHLQPHTYPTPFLLSTPYRQNVHAGGPGWTK